jgi:alanyl-tRNA synthetase
MLGNWSLGDYFKEEAITWSFEFLTSRKYLGINPSNLFVTIFAGNNFVPRDDESARVWRKLGIPESHIFALPEKDNWWGPAGETGPCGPDTEMFIDTGKPRCGPECRPGCSCGKYFEVWNDVFMQYEKKKDGSFVPLRQHNVDTGMGVERTVAILQGKASVYETEVFEPLLKVIEENVRNNTIDPVRLLRAKRVIADHIRSATFILGDERGGVVPSNLGQGYVLRRLIRRAIRYARLIGIEPGFITKLAEIVVETSSHSYPELAVNKMHIVNELAEEEKRFEKTLSRGIVELNKTLEKMKAAGTKILPGKIAFRLYDTYGFPVEFTEEICRENGFTVDREGFERAFSTHRDVSKAGSERVFKGGLADATEATARLHTATHLLHQSLRKVLGEHVQQKGSNITPERLRFDFSHPRKLTEEEIKKVEDMVNEIIAQDLPVEMEIMPLKKAIESGAIALFGAKYGEQVKVYKIGNFSKEVCGGPHAKRTGELGHFRIVKEEACSAGIRRIRAVLDGQSV